MAKIPKPHLRGQSSLVRKQFRQSKKSAASASEDGPIYDLLRAYGQLTFGNLYPRVMASEKAKQWRYDYIRAHSSGPCSLDTFAYSVIEPPDETLAEDTFKFFLNPDVKERLMNSYRERQSQMFAEKVDPPNLDPILVRVPLPPHDQEYRFGFTGYKTLSDVQCDPFLLKPQPAGTVGAAIQMLQKLDPTLPLYFDCPDCGKGHLIKTVRFSAVIETQSTKESDHVR